MAREVEGFDLSAKPDVDPLCDTPPVPRRPKKTVQDEKGRRLAGNRKAGQRHWQSKNKPSVFIDASALEDLVILGQRALGALLATETVLWGSAALSESRA